MHEVHRTFVCSVSSNSRLQECKDVLNLGSYNLPSLFQHSYPNLHQCSQFTMLTWGLWWSIFFGPQGEGLKQGAKEHPAIIKKLEGPKFNSSLFIYVNDVITTYFYINRNVKRLLSGNGGSHTSCLRPPMWSLERTLLSKAHSCKQQLVEGLISIKQAPGMNSKMTRVTKLKKRSSNPVPQWQCPRYPCKLGKQPRHVGDEQQH